MLIRPTSNANLRATGRKGSRVVVSLHSTAPNSCAVLNQRRPPPPLGRIPTPNLYTSGERPRDQATNTQKKPNGCFVASVPVPEGHESEPLGLCKRVGVRTRFSSAEVRDKTNPLLSPVAKKKSVADYSPTPAAPRAGPSPCWATHPTPARRSARSRLGPPPRTPGLSTRPC